MVQHWALLVGIEKYASDKWEETLGAKRDVKAVRDYLEHDLEVPSENIRVLEDQDATRKSIIKTFQVHLIDNTRIEQGDAILFLFSGHGSRYAAPPNWPIIEEEGELEMIMPFDEGMAEERERGEICGIPDRTLAVLLDEAAKAHGSNITVILDCCHSGHGTRDGGDEAFPFKPRGVDPRLVVPLRSDVDQDIWSGQEQREGQKFFRGAFTEHRAGSHVLMAACGKKEQAFSDENGGLLTTFFLKALRNEEIYPRTYAEMMKYIHNDFENLRKKYPKWDIPQHPQCEGVTRDRLVFQDVMADPKVFSARKDGHGRVRIEAGEVHGITANTIFELYNLSDNLRGSRSLGTATVIKVDTTHCYANVAEGVRPAGSLTALVLQQAYRLRYSVVNTAPNSSIAQNVVYCIERSIQSKSGSQIESVLQRVDYGDPADLVLEIDDCDDGGVVFRRHDIHLRDIDTRSTRLDAKEVKVADFPLILNAVARFNYYMEQTSKTHPFAGEVDIELHLLESDDFDYFGDLTETKKLKQQVLFKNDEATVVFNDGDSYAFILRNSGETHLYPYLVYFDPGTYQIDTTWYEPSEDRPTLLPNRTLQIGASPERMWPFNWFLREGDTKDISFVKIFLLDSYAKMGFMSQPPVIGRDEEGRSYIGAENRAEELAAGIDAPPRRGQWDSISRKVTVVSEQSAAGK